MLIAQLHSSHVSVWMHWKYSMDFHLNWKRTKETLKRSWNCSKITVLVKQMPPSYGWYLFNTRVQESGETFESFVSSLRQLSLSCNFTPTDTQLRCVLLQEPKLTLKVAIEHGRATETTKRQLKIMATTDEVSMIRKSKQSLSYKQQ